MKSICEIIKDWKDEALNGTYYRQETTAIHRCGKKLFIITRYPASLFIGYYGHLINTYKRVLKENGYDLEPWIIDLGIETGIREF